MTLHYRKLSPIYSPIINITVPILKPVYIRLRTRLNLRRFLIDLNSSKTPVIRLVYDCGDSPPTYGDFVTVVLLGRFLGYSGYQIRFTILSQKRRKDWPDNNSSQQDLLVTSFREIATKLLPLSSVVEVTNYIQREAFEIHLGGKAFYNSVPYVFHLLVRKFGWDIPEDFLLSSNSVSVPSPYISWHLRSRSYDAHRNLTAISVRNDFQLLQTAFPNHDIMVFGEAEALVETYLALTGSPDVKAQEIAGTSLIPQPEYGYQESISYLLKSRFYFQRGGGGLGIIPMFSSLPYIYLCPDKTYFFMTKKFRVLPWSNSNQFFVYVKKGLENYQATPFLRELDL